MLSRVQVSHCPRAHRDAEALRRMENVNSQQDHELQQDQGGQQDLGDPGTGEKGTGQSILHFLLSQPRAASSQWGGGTSGVPGQLLQPWELCQGWGVGPCPMTGGPRGALGAVSLTVSPRSPLLPAGPTGPGAPGAPGAPGGPAGPVSPRSPCEEEEEERDEGERSVWARTSLCTPQPPPQPTHLGTSSTITTGGTFSTGSTLGRSGDPLLGQVGGDKGLGGTVLLSPVRALLSIDCSVHQCHELLSPHAAKPSLTWGESVPPNTHLTSSFTRGSRQARGAHGARGTTLARGAGGTLLARFTLRRREAGGCQTEHPPRGHSRGGHTGELDHAGVPAPSVPAAPRYSQRGRAARGSLSRLSVRGGRQRRAGRRYPGVRGCRERPGGETRGISGRWQRQGHPRWRGRPRDARLGEHDAARHPRLRGGRPTGG